MQVNLKQSEIESALKNFISHQGISLYGKEVSISFTAGRRETGISAEVTIEDMENCPQETITTGIPSVLLKRGAEAEMAVAHVLQVSTEDVQAAAEVGADAQVAAEIVEATEEVQAKTTSLFGGN